MTKPLRVAPLFETLDDLDHSESAMEQLLSNKWCGALVCIGALPAVQLFDVSRDRRTLLPPPMRAV